MKKRDDQNRETILTMISNPLRSQVLQYLSQKSPLSFTDIMEKLKMDPASDAGKFGYHLRALKDSQLISGGSDTGYKLTKIGEKVVEFLWTLGDLIKSEALEDIQVRTSKYSVEKFDRNKISMALQKEANVPKDLADDIAKEAEERLINSKIKYFTAPLIREYVNFILLERGLENYRHALTRLGLPPFDVKELIKSQKTYSNPNVVQRVAGDAILEQYLLLNILDHDIADAHLSGNIFIPNANYFILRPNSVQHDARVFLSNGLTGIGSLITISPPKNFRTALSILEKIFNVSNSASEQSFDHFNVFLAPYIRGLSKEDIKDNLRNFLEDIGYTFNYWGKSINLEFLIPPYLKDSPAVGPEGKIMGNYEDYLEETQLLLSILLDVLIEGDIKGRPFLLPNQLLKIRPEVLTSKNYEDLLIKVHELILKFGTPYLINATPDWQTENVNMTGGINRLAADWKEVEVDTLRTGNLDWVIINLPRIAYESENDDSRFLELLRSRLNLAGKALIQKREIIESRMMEDKLLPFLSALIQGEPYFRIDNATCSLSFIGLPQAVKIHTNSNISENKTSAKFANQIIHYFHTFSKSISEETGFRFTVKQPYSNSWSIKLAELDKEYNIWKKIKIDKEHIYNFYTAENIYNLKPINWKSRIALEEEFHKYLNGGHMSLFSIDNDSENPARLLNKTIDICKSSIGMFGYVHNFTYCSLCGIKTNDFTEKCQNCGSAGPNINHYSRLIGPYRIITPDNKIEMNYIKNRKY
ncbi:MAG: anaerobic ribonucleoside-triphosphate reductase [Candidatus Helarchaeota archaeon]